MDQTAIRVFSIYGRLAPVSRSQQDCQQSGKDSGCPQNIEQTPRQASAPIWPDHSARRRRRRSAKSHSHGTARSEPRSSWSWHITPPSISDFSISVAGICMDVAKNPKPFCCTFMKKLSTPLCNQFRIKQKRHPIGCLFLAERGGFEPHKNGLFIGIFGSPAYFLPKSYILPVFYPAVWIWLHIIDHPIPPHLVGRLKSPARCHLAHSWD